LNRGGDEVRVAFMHEAETLTRAMKVLGAAVNAYPWKMTTVDVWAAFPTVSQS